MNSDELRAAYANGNRDFAEADLSGANLRGTNLRGTNLRWADLREADLSEASLSGANLSGADTREADLSGADLSGADLSEANLRGTNLRWADLSGADLSGANLREADLREADLRNCMGVYSAHSPFMSSRNDALYAGAFEQDGELVLLFNAGCQTRKTADELREKVRETHGENAHAIQYLAAIAFIEACYASDKAAGRFDVKAETEPEAIS